MLVWGFFDIIRTSLTRFLSEISNRFLDHTEAQSHHCDLVVRCDPATHSTNVTELINISPTLLTLTESHVRPSIHASNRQPVRVPVPVPCYFCLSPPHHLPSRFECSISSLPLSSTISTFSNS